MHVLVTLNKGYLTHFYAMLTSLLYNTSNAITVYVMHDDLTSIEEGEIRKRFPTVTFSFIFMDKSFCDGFPTTKRYPYTVYYRIFAPLFLPETLERVLYLDCDLIVHNSIDSFYNTDFAGNLLVACSHIGAFLRFFNQIRLGGKSTYVYMNTGVLLMNLPLFRQVLDVEKIKAYTLRHKRKLVLFDQDILYAFFGDRVLRKNALIYNLSDRQILWHNRFHRKKITKKWVRDNNVIVHYIGRNKPWKIGYKGILDVYYHEYAKRSNYTK